MSTMVRTGVWIGALDLRRHGEMLQHTVLDSAQRHDYPEDVGGFWAYSKCGDPAYYYEDGTAAARALPECPECQDADS